MTVVANHSLMAISEAVPSHSQPDTSKLTVPELLFAGAVAGSLAKSTIAPLDRIKILIQTNPKEQFSVKTAYRIGREIVVSGGFPALWRGNLATLIRVVPYSATNFMVFSKTRDFFQSTFPDWKDSPLLKFSAGAVSGSMATALTYPLETMRARMAVDKSGAYRGGYIPAVRSIMRAEGGLALWSGLIPTLTGIIPYAGISFMTYETLKKENINRLLSGAIAGVLAQSATYPLDVVRRRMQVNPKEYTSMTVAFREILLKEGPIKGLYKGLSMNWLKGPLAVAISLTTNDMVKEWIASNHDTI